MERRLASAIILIEPQADIVKINQVLSKHADIVLGRLGVNLKHRNIRVISLIIEANTDQIGALSGQLGLIQGVKIKIAILKTDKKWE